MSRDVKHYFSETAEQGSIAETLARETFARAHPDQRVVRASLRADEQERFVVLVQHGPLSDRRFACYAIAKSDYEVTEVADPSPYLPER